MKHLRRYNESHTEPLSEIIEYIKDICLELKDEGFSINNYISQDLYSLSFEDIISLNSRKSTIEINRFGGLAWSPYPKFEISDVYETVCTIINYMESVGYRTDVKINSEDMQSAAMRTSLNDITTIFDAVRKHRQDPKSENNLDGLGRVRYIKLYFTKD